MASSIALLMAILAGIATTRSSAPTGLGSPTNTWSWLRKASSSMTGMSRSKSKPSGTTVPTIPFLARNASAARGLMSTWRALGNDGHMMRSIMSLTCWYGVRKFLAFGPSQ